MSASQRQLILENLVTTLRGITKAHGYKSDVAAVEALDAGETNAIMVFRDGTYGHLPIQAVADAKYHIDPALLKLGAPLGR
jgi:hypothetical protein